MASQVNTSARSLMLRIEEALPQTQCTRCGFPDCTAYAEAMAFEGAPINQCPPGGQEGIERLSAITGRPALPLNPEHGREGPLHLAVIDENWCIGCTLCIKACPTDAIVGSHKHMHTVIEPWCTGCELCLPVCPVDCIQLENTSGERTGWAAWSPVAAETARQRYTSRQKRLLSQREKHEQRQLEKARTKLEDLQTHTRSEEGDAGLGERERKRAILEAVLSKAKARQRPT